MGVIDLKRKKGSAPVSRALIRRPLRRWFPLFMGPVVCAFIIGFVYPFCKGVYLSFCKFKTTSDAEFIGLGNYVKALQDASFMHSFWYTGLFALVSLVFINVLAFAAAYALTQGIKGSSLFRTVFFMPNLIGGIVLGYVWSMIFDGILTRYNTSILLETKYGFWGLVILMCWQQIGYMMIIYIAGLQAVPDDMLEAAKIDGASRWQKITHVTLPSLKSTIIILVLMSLSGIFRSDFGLFYQVTQNSGPLIKVTQTIDTYVYRGLMQTNNIGMSSAAGVYQSVVGFILVMAANGIVRKVDKDSALF